MKRRDVIRSAGLAVSSSVVGAAQASSTDERIGAQEIGIADKLDSLLKRGRTDAARRLADRHDIRGHFGPRKPVGSGDDVSTHAKRLEDPTDASVSLYQLNSRDWRSWGDVKLRGAKFAANDFVLEKDVMGITWNDSIWASKGAEEAMYGVWDSDVTNVTLSDVGSGALATTIDFKNGGVGGFGGEEDRSPQDFYIQVELEQLQDIPGSEVGTTLRYDHTGAPTDFGGLGVSVGGGAISVSTGVGGTTHWTLFRDASP